METKETKEQKVIKFFLNNPKATIIEISSATGISKSSCQRYLNLPGYASLIIPSTGLTIAEQLKLNRIAGNQKGGRTTFLTHTVQKDKDGKFNGLIRDEEDQNKEEAKQEDIIRIVRYFSQHPYTTLEEMATFFDKIYTPSYIYNCLNDSRVEELFGSLIANTIRKQLENNRYGIMKKFKGKWGQELFEAANLTEREIAVLNHRFQDGEIHSAEEVALIYGVSKTLITKIEDEALEKITQYQKRVNVK